jgi:hypothetical protein
MVTILEHGSLVRFCISPDHTTVPELPSHIEWRSEKAPDLTCVFIGGPEDTVSYKRCYPNFAKQSPVTIEQLRACIDRMRERTTPDTDFHKLLEWSKKIGCPRPEMTTVDALVVNYLGCVACAIQECARLRPKDLFVFVDNHSDCKMHQPLAHPTWSSSTITITSRDCTSGTGVPKLRFSGAQFQNIMNAAHPTTAWFVDALILSEDVSKADQDKLIDMIGHRVFGAAVIDDSKVLNAEEDEEGEETDEDKKDDEEAERRYLAGEDYFGEDEVGYTQSKVIDILECFFPRTKRQRN